MANSARATTAHKLLNVGSRRRISAGGCCYQDASDAANSGKTMDVIILQLLNGLDKGGAYALIALGLTLIFGTLGVVNFAHGALFMLGAFCAVSFNKLLSLEIVTTDPTKTTAWGTPLEIRTPYIEAYFGDFGNWVLNYSVPVSILLAIPVMLLFGFIMERGLIKHFYNRAHADQILVTFGLAIVLQEIIKSIFGANPIPQTAPDAVRGAAVSAQRSGWILA